MNREEWTGQLSDDELQVVIGCLCHSLHDFDAPCLYGRWTLAASLLAQMDGHINDPERPPSSFVERIPGRMRRPLWASLWATVRDIHAAQDLLTDEEWAELAGLLAVCQPTVILETDDLSISMSQSIGFGETGADLVRLRGRWMARRSAA